MTLAGDTRFYAELAEQARAVYDSAYASRYREQDTNALDYRTHVDQGELLRDVTESFGRPIDVLDLACGTGRYWHYLHNVRSLVGVDISPDMLKLAAHPVREETLTFSPILICGNLAEVEFRQQFDLIYAIGVFVFIPFDQYIVAKLAHWLKPGGQLVVTTEEQCPQPTSWKRRCAEAALPILPASVRRRVRTRLRDFALSEADLRGLMVGWTDVRITRRMKSRGSEWICRATHT